MDPIEKLVPIVLFCVMGYIIKSYYDYKLKKSIIEKGEVNANVEYLFKHHARPHSYSSVKWGIVLFAIGAALLIGELFRYDISEEMTFGLMLVFAGVALIFTHKLNGNGSKNEPPAPPPPNNQI
jgi:hypothetical protein